jgi:hypothetical protein
MKLIASITCALTLVACGTNDSDDDGSAEGAREFQLKIENIAPWTLLKVGAQSTLAGTMVTGWAPTGYAYEARFTAGPGHNLTFATSLIESNDWFFAPDAAGIPLYVNGQQNVGDITHLVRLWDAGTEINQALGTGNATCGVQTMRDFGAPDPDSRVRKVTETTVGGYPVPAINSMIKVTLAKGTQPDAFVLRIENVSTATTLQTAVDTRSIRISPVAWSVSRNPDAFFTEGNGARPNGLAALAEQGIADTMSNAVRLDRGVATALGRGVFVVHTEQGPLFNLETSDYGLGMEALAEDADNAALLANLKSTGRDSTVVGAFDTPVGGTSSSAAAPGQSFELTFKASKGDKLAIAAAFVASNDWFFGSTPDGIPLFLGDIPRWEDVTSDFYLWDLGTETDEELDVGLNVGSQQVMPNSGRVDRLTNARQVTADKYATPVNQHIRVTLTPTDKL